jgi:hypothetical protein
MALQHADIAERKALLATRAELDRVRLTIAVYEVKSIVRPPRSAARLAAVRPIAISLVGFLVPVIGFRRFRRWIKIGSMALTILRVIYNWRH